MCAGDVFDTYNQPAELVNFAADTLPDMYAVPGQHDLPYHRYQDIEKSSFWTLVLLNKIKLLTRIPTQHGFLRMFGFGWGKHIHPVPRSDSLSIDLCVAHQYVWWKQHKYPDAPGEANLSRLSETLKGYDAAVFGDNHKGFLSRVGDCSVLNSGGFLIMKSDEIDYQPCVGILYSDGRIEREKLDTSKDIYFVQEKQPANLDRAVFSDALENVVPCEFDFMQRLDNRLKKPDITEEVRQIILKGIEKCK